MTREQLQAKLEASAAAGGDSLSSLSGISRADSEKDKRINAVIDIKERQELLTGKRAMLDFGEIPVKTKPWRTKI